MFAWLCINLSGFDHAHKCKPIFPIVGPFSLFSRSLSLSQISFRMHLSVCCDIVYSKWLVCRQHGRNAVRQYCAGYEKQRWINTHHCTQTESGKKFQTAIFDEHCISHHSPILVLCCIFFPIFLLLFSLAYFLRFVVKIGSNSHPFFSSHDRIFSSTCRTKEKQKRNTEYSLTHIVHRKQCTIDWHLCVDERKHICFKSTHRLSSQHHPSRLTIYDIL